MSVIENYFFIKKYLIFFILLFTSIIKIPLLYNGYPIINNLDEPYVINSGLRILSNFYYNKSLDPEFYDWGSFPLYISAIINSLLIFFKFFFLNTKSLSLQEIAFSIERVDFVLANRFFSLILMNVSILIIFFFCKKNFNFKIAILASIIAILSPAYFHRSSLATIDHWSFFFSTIIIYLCFKINNNFYKIHNIYLYGFILGISVATKYINIFLIIPFLVIVLENKKKKFLIIKNFFILFFSSLLTFFTLMPYFFLKYEAVISSIVKVSQIYSSDRPGSSDLNNSYFILLKNFFSMSFINSLISILFIVSFFLIKNKKNFYVFFLYPIFFSFFLGAYKNFNTRNIISIIPFVSIMTSIILYKLNNKFHFKKILIFLIIIYLPVININLKMILNSFLIDTRYISLLWIKENLLPEDQILVGHYGPPVQDLKNFRNTRRLWFLNDFNKDLDFREIDSDVKYIVLSSHEYSRYFNESGDLIEKYKDKGGNLYKFFFDNNNLIKIFNPSNGTQGPQIRIYLNSLYKGD
jgi:hypothetical protein